MHPILCDFTRAFRGPAPLLKIFLQLKKFKLFFYLSMINPETMIICFTNKEAHVRKMNRAFCGGR